MCTLENHKYQGSIFHGIVCTLVPLCMEGYSEASPSDYGCKIGNPQYDSVPRHRSEYEHECITTPPMPLYAMPIVYNMKSWVDESLAYIEEFSVLYAEGFGNV